jgi:purine catabolism regulator
VTAVTNRRPAPDPAEIGRPAALRPFTVADLLDLPVLRRGRPSVLAGADLARRPVRWVHTSEIYEISPLLKGGEVLLTTGLGLVGAGPAAVRGYATGLAERSIAALVLELGRTFTTAPEALVEGARESGLPLIVLRGIVPFIEITETVHALLLSEEVTRLRSVERITSALTPTLLSGAGLIAVLRTLAELADCPVRLYAGDGHLVAASDHRAVQPDREAGSDQLDRTADWPEAPVELFGRPWGTLVVCGPPHGTRALVAEQGAVVAALELGRAGTGGTGTGRRRAGAHLLRDIFGRQYSSADEVTGRAAALGMVIGPRQRAFGICLAVDAAGPSGDAGAGRRPIQRADHTDRAGRGVRGDPRPMHDVRGPGNAARGEPRRVGHGNAVTPSATSAAVADAAEQLFGAALVAELDGSHLVAACTDADDLRAVLHELADRVDAALPAGRSLAVTCGPPVGEIAALAGSLRTARETSVLARRLDSGMRVLLSTDLGVHRLLSRFAADPELAAFVDEQLGPLLDHDAARGRELVRTLDTLLACGLAKAATARALGIRRQTLYQRLGTISTLLGGLDLGSRERRTAIDLALVGWRLRAAAVP